MQHCLSELSLFEKGRIALLNSNGAMRRRLLDLGFVPGTEVTALFAGHRDGIRAYAVAGSVIAIRRATAKEIMLD